MREVVHPQEPCPSEAPRPSEGAEGHPWAFGSTLYTLLLTRAGQAPNSEEPYSACAYVFPSHGRPRDERSRAREPVASLPSHNPSTYADRSWYGVAMLRIIAVLVVMCLHVPIAHATSVLRSL